MNGTNKTQMFLLIKTSFHNIYKTKSAITCRFTQHIFFHNYGLNKLESYVADLKRKEKNYFKQNQIQEVLSFTAKHDIYQS